MENMLTLFKGRSDSQLIDNNSTEVIPRETRWSAVGHKYNLYRLVVELQARELRHSHQLLDETLEFYSSLFDFSPISCVTFDSNGQVKELNLTAAEFLKVDRERVIGDSFVEWLSEDSVSKFRGHLLECFRTQQKITTLVDMKVPHDNHIEKVSVVLSTISLREQNGAENNSDVYFQTAIIDLRDIHTAVTA